MNIVLLQRPEMASDLQHISYQCFQTKVLTYQCFLTMKESHHCQIDSWSEIRWWVPQTQRKPPITGSSSCKCQILLIAALLPVSVPQSWTTSNEVSQSYPQSTRIIPIPTHPGGHSTQTSHPGWGHSKSDYRVNEAIATVSTGRSCISSDILTPTMD